MTQSTPPSSPREFFERYLPGWFAKAAPSGTSSPGTLVFRIDDESFALRLVAGKLEVKSDDAGDAILRVLVSGEDFGALIEQGQALFESGSSDRLLALRSLSLDAERAELIRRVDGSVAFEIDDGSRLRTLLLSPGALTTNAAPACSVRVASVDFWALSRGEKHPFELLMDGKIRVQGRMEVAMALSSVLTG